MSLPSRLLGANPSIQVSTLLSGSLTTPSAKTAASKTAFIGIASTLVDSSGTSTVTFSSIPATYDHLQVRLIAQSSRPTYSRDEWHIRLNSDSGSNYAWHGTYANGTTLSSVHGTGDTKINGQDILGTNVDNFWGVAIIDILDYANTNKYKTVRIFGGLDTNNAGVSGFNGALDHYGGTWKNTAAVSTITFVNSSSTNFRQYSRFALYGIGSNSVL